MRQSLATFCPCGQGNSYDRIAIISFITDRNIPQSTLLAHKTWSQSHSFITACKGPQTLSFSHGRGQSPNLVQLNLGSVYIQQCQIFFQFPPQFNPFLVNVDKPGNVSISEYCGSRFHSVGHLHVQTAGSIFCKKELTKPLFFNFPNWMNLRKKDLSSKLIKQLGETCFPDPKRQPTLSGKPLFSILKILFILIFALKGQHRHLGNLAA